MSGAESTSRLDVTARPAPPTATVRSLDQAFYARPSEVVARELLNKVLVVDACRGRIVEVEAYGGSDDPASHAARGRTTRNAAMFGSGGRLYVYRCYGIHWCANVVTGVEGIAEAVLLRAVEPLSGLDEMRSRRPGIARAIGLANGPGKLASAFGIDGRFDGVTIGASNELAVDIVDDGVASPAPAGAGPRVGISRETLRPWRFWVPGSRCVSR